MHCFCIDILYYGVIKFQAQFFIVMTLAARTLYTGCDFPLWMQWGLVVYGSIIILLFVNFYVHAYVRSPNTKAKLKV